MEHVNYGNIRVPPSTAPKPYNQSAAYRQASGQGYRQVNVQHIPDDFRGFPPPPPPDTMPKGYGYDPDDDLPPPPPPAPPQAFAEDSQPYSHVYRREARYASSDDYRPPDYDLATSPHSPGGHSYPGESNYANIQINIAPPTPTSKDSGYNIRSVSPSSPYVQMGPRGGASPRSPQTQPGRPASGERPVPGPMVPSPPPSQQSYINPEIPSSPKTGYSSRKTTPSSPSNSKEAEVDALTDLLVKNMTSAAEDENFWGMCGRCGNTVSGSTNACSALDNVYHIGCFTCVGCNAPLQGKSFFAMENKPHCEVCYVASLERCSVCSSPITDRLLRATGKPYHPDCFTCVVCGKSLDGIPFTVDATNQIHCIEDFHKKFAPRCCLCQRPIMPDSGQDETVRIVAMDKSFHVDCYRCEDCGTQLSSEAAGGCYPLDDHILCKNCNAKRIQHLTTKMQTEL